MSAAPSNVVPFPNPHQVAAATAQARPVVPYNMEPAFEAAFITACCCRPRLFGRVADFVEVEAFASPVGKLAWEAIEKLKKDNGQGPSSLLIVLQRLRADVVSGKVKQEQIEEVADYFDAAEDKKLPSDEDIFTVLVPMLSRRVEREALEEAFQEFSKAGDLTKPMERVERVRKMAEVEVDDTIEGTDDTRKEMIRRANLPRIATGILEMDDALGGGPKLGTACMLLGPSSAGKSMGLVQVGAAAVLRRKNVAYASLELNKEDILARFIANITGMPIDCATEDRVWNAYQRALQEYGAGRLFVRQFTPKITTVRDIVTWVKGLEEKNKILIDELVIDYGDKVGSGSKRHDEADTGYIAQGTVYDQMFTWARDNERLLWTASQSGRESDNTSKTGSKKVVQMDDVADSMGKVRNFDLVIGLNPRDEFTMMLFNILKNRNGGGRGTQVGPLPVEFSCARIAPPFFPPKLLVLP